MDSNKDEAERCLDFAEGYLRAGNLNEAKKFIKKAQKLYPTKRAEDLLSKVSSHSNDNSKRNEDDGHKAAEYTHEQINLVRRVNRCKDYDYYEILNIKKDATSDEIKKAYKKIALLLHPDKNKAPGAEEAFKKIGNAAAVLTDAQKKNEYDKGGYSPTPHNQHAYSYAQNYQSDITAEELFNMFFGGFPQQEFYVRTGNSRWRRQTASHSQNTHSQSAHGYTTFLQMLPVLLLIVLTMMSSFFISDPLYSLSVSSKYSVQRTTSHLKVPYYVKENFHEDYTDNIRRLEISVEEDYVNFLRHSCYREKNYRESMIWKARSFGDHDQYDRARRIETPSCTKLSKIQAG